MNTVEEKATELVTSPSELRKRKQFAEMYDPAALSQLLELELSWAHVQNLLVVDDADDRWQFAVDANEHGWSAEDLACQIKARQGVGNRGGRPFKDQALNPGSLYKLKKAAVQMGRRFKAFDMSPDAGMSDEERTTCGNLLPKVLKALEELQADLRLFTDELATALLPPKP